MTDRRLTPANGRVAAQHLAGLVTADLYLDGWAMTIARPVVDLCTSPDGPRDRQLLLGVAVQVFEDRDGWAFVQAADGYVGYIRSEGLVTAGAPPTHFVATPATHAYGADDFKAPLRCQLPFGARLRVIDERKRFFQTEAGFVPKKHLRGLDRPFSDPASVAQLHFGVPYLWGGNSTRGIDCSGLISAALSGCGLACPGDSDLQAAALGHETTGSYLRGDLLFWQGHVGMMVDTETLIHANAHHMACVYEPVKDAILRIAAQGDGALLAHKRL